MIDLSKKDPFFAREAKKYPNPLPSREYIKIILENFAKPVSIGELYDFFDIKQPEIKTSFKFRLRAMIRDQELMLDRKKFYCLMSKINLIAGTVIIQHEGYGFVLADSDKSKIVLSPFELKKVFHGDKVLVQTNKNYNKKRGATGKIHEVSSRGITEITGCLMQEKHIFCVSSDNKRIIHDIYIDSDDLNGAKAGDIVTAKIIQYPTKKKHALGEIIEIIGAHMAPGMEIDVALRSHNLRYKWPDEVQQQIKEIVKDKSLEHQRKDLTNLNFVTIDGSDAKDFDDAVYCEQRKTGGWRLFVAIADVSFYVTPNSALDQEAFARATSIYFPNRVVPMLPEVLSDDLCSLNPKQDKFVVVCEMTISNNARVGSYKFYRAKIQSKYRLTYDEVADMLDKKQQIPTAIEPSILSLYEMYQQSIKARQKRGALDFDTVETKIIFNEQQKISKIEPVHRNDAHKLIEECMLHANVSAARFLSKTDFPVLYRVHTPPKNRIEELNTFLKEIGIKMPKKPKPIDYNNVLTLAKTRVDYNLIQKMVLRSLSQAIYSQDNQGHFGLAYPAYTHFTSPIRRYPDLMVHRAILHTIDKQNKYEYDESKCKQIASHCSDMERLSDDASRDVASWLKCEYMQDQIGNKFKGTISTVTNFGIFIELNDIYVEGLVHISYLAKDYYEFNEVHHELIGKYTGKIYKIGEQVDIIVASVDLDNRKIDFDLLEPV